MSDRANKHLRALKWITLRVSEDEYQDLKQEAEHYGYHLSNLLRLRVFGKTNLVRNSPRPVTDMTLLGDIIGMLTCISGDLNKNSSSIQKIVVQMSQCRGDAFGLDFCLRFLEQLNERFLKVLELIEATLSQRRKFRPEKREDGENSKIRSVPDQRAT